MSEHTYEKFLEIHEGQLLTSHVPSHFWATLYEKLKNQVKIFVLFLNFFIVFLGNGWRRVFSNYYRRR